MPGCYVSFYVPKYLVLGATCEGSRFDFHETLSDGYFTMMIRKFHPNDTDALVAIWNAASSLAHPFLKKSFLAREADNVRTLHLPSAETWVLEDDGHPVGFIALVGDEIGGLFLDPSRHGQGLGKALVDHAVANKGPLRVEVFEKNTIGRRFYDRYGFVEVGRYLHVESGETTLQLRLPSC